MKEQSERAATVHRRHAAGLGCELSFRHIDPTNLDRDVRLVHDWMNRSHVVPFWDLARPLASIREYLLHNLADRHQIPYIGLADGVPMSYWEAYQAAADAVGEYYPAHPEDRGVHLLIGPPEYLGRGYSRPLLRAMVEFQFQYPETEKVIAEPDVRNARMIHVFERCGFERQREIELPEKRATLMFCHRERFFELLEGSER